MTELDTQHYFDWAATTPPDEDILRQALDESLQAWGNPSSIHKAGSEAKQLLTDIRRRCAAVLSVPEDTVYFTSGGTESDHIPLLAMLTRPAPATILVSSLEHAAVREQAAALEHCGWNIRLIPSDKNGIITPQAVLSALTDDTVLVCVMAVNNETGAVQPVYEIADALTQSCKGRRRPRFHVDCVQGCGKIPLSIAHPGIDSAAFSAHKLCGPRGIGILYLASSCTPFLRGGGQEKNIRSGTENLYGAAAFSKCLERYYLRPQNTAAMERFEAQKTYIREFIKKIAAIPSCTVIPEIRSDGEHEQQFSPWIVQAAFKDIPGQVMVRALSSKGFYISTGSACSAKKQSRPILEAMHVPADKRETAVRFSFGPKTTAQGMAELYEAVADICRTFSK